MKQSARVFIFLAVALMPVLACSGDDEDDEDCNAAKNGELNVKPTQRLGDDCTIAYYGACKTAFTSCGEGTCQIRPSDGKKECTTTCKATSDCRSGTYCIEGACWKPATCTTSCDGATCCNYAVDPADPTKCKQTSCTKT